MDHDELIRFEELRKVYQALPNRQFRDRLAAENADGQRFIIPALPDDPIGVIAEKVREAGGVANIVIATNDGFVILNARHSSFPLDNHSPTC